MRTTLQIIGVLVGLLLRDGVRADRGRHVPEGLLPMLALAVVAVGVAVVLTADPS